jgi:hypothetical protein
MSRITVILPSKIFAFDGERAFTATASACEAISRLGQIDYANGEWFFHMRSAKTGKLARFVRTSEVHAGGRLHSVRFICQEHGGLLATIIND